MARPIVEWLLGKDTLVLEPGIVVVAERFDGPRIIREVLLLASGVEASPWLLEELASCLNAIREAKGGADSHLSSAVLCEKLLEHGGTGDERPRLRIVGNVVPRVLVGLALDDVKVV